MHRRLLCVTAVVLVTAAARLAHASAADVFGLGSAESAVCGASVARVGDFSAAFYDPAGLTLARRAEVSVGALGFGSVLSINGKRAELTDPFGLTIGAVAPVPFIGLLADRVYVGIALWLLPDSLVRVLAHHTDAPFFPYYDNRTQRLLVLPAVALRLWHGVSLGIGFNYLAGLEGQVSSGVGATRAVEARVDQQVSATVAVNAGLRWQATGRLALAATFRQSLSVPFRVATRNSIAGQEIDISVAAEQLFTPHELVVGGALHVLPRLLLSLDLQWSLWSQWRGPFVEIASLLPILGNVSPAVPQLHYSDTFGVRLGADWTAIERRALSLRVRGGYAFETSPIPSSEPGVTNLLDGNKHTIALGAGVRWAWAHGGALRVDVHGQLQVVQSSTLVKKLGPVGSDPLTAVVDMNNPGYPKIQGGGEVWSAGLTATVER